MEKYPCVSPATYSKVHKFLNKNNFDSSDSRDSQDVTEVGVFIINPSALRVGITVSFTYNPLFSNVIEQMTDFHGKVSPVPLLFPSVEIAFCSCSLEISIWGQATIRPKNQNDHISGREKLSEWPNIQSGTFLKRTNVV